MRFLCNTAIAASKLNELTLVRDTGEVHHAFSNHFSSSFIHIFAE